MKPFVDNLQVTKGSQVRYTLETRTLLGLKVVQQHEGYESKDIIRTPFYQSSQYLLRARKGVEMFQNHKSYFHDKFFPKGSARTQSRSFIHTIEDEDYFELMYEVLDFTPAQSIDFAFAFYLQSFVDTFNARRDINYYNGPVTLPFQKDKEVQKYAMQTNNQFILKFRKNPFLLAGFAADGPVRRNKEKIDELIKLY